MRCDRSFTYPEARQHPVTRNRRKGERMVNVGDAFSGSRAGNEGIPCPGTEFRSNT